MIKQLEMDLLLTLDEAAEYLRVSKSSIYKKVAVKGIPHFRCGRLIRFKAAELEKWVQAGREGS